MICFWTFSKSYFSILFESPWGYRSLVPPHRGAMSRYSWGSDFFKAAKSSVTANGTPNADNCDQLCEKTRVARGSWGRSVSVPSSQLGCLEFPDFSKKPFQAANLAAWNFQIFPSSQVHWLEYPEFSKKQSWLLGKTRKVQAAKLAAWNTLSVVGRSATFSF